MRGLIPVKWVVVALLLAVGLWIPTVARAQAATGADIQRLQDEVYDASSDLSRLRGRDAALADRLQDDLDNLREDVIYLKVKLRREGQVNESEYNEVRDRLRELRGRARGEGTYGDSAAPMSGSGSYKPSSSPTGQSAPAASAGGRPAPNEPRQTSPGGSSTIPVGAELDVRLQTQLSSDDATVEDRFQATTVVDMMEDGRVVIPAGSTVRGVVTGVEKAGRLHRTGRLTLGFDQVTIDGRAYPIHATVTQAIESEGIRGEAGKIGAGAGIGGIIGGILGGFKGALAGILIGGGGTVAATEGKDVTLPPGTVLRLRFDSALTVR